MTKTLIVPGRSAATWPHWPMWWSLSDPGALLVAPALDGETDPEAWEMQVAGAVLNHPGAVLVGHGYGALMIAHLLTAFPKLEVAAALLVAPGDAAAGMAAPERPLPVPTILAASRNDPHLSFERAETLALLWGADLVDLGRAGRVDAAAGYGSWPEALTFRDWLLRRTGPLSNLDLAPTRLSA